MRGRRDRGMRDRERERVGGRIKERGMRERERQTEGTNNKYIRKHNTIRGNDWGRGSILIDGSPSKTQF